MENLNSPLFKPAILNGELQIGMRPETVLQMIAVDDIGHYGALAFERRDELANTAIDIAGDQLTGPQAASAIGEVLGRPVRFVSPPIEQIRAFSEDYAIMLEWFDAVGYDVDIAANRARFGIEPTRFVDWARGVDWSS